MYIVGVAVQFTGEVYHSAECPMKCRGIENQSIRRRNCAFITYVRVNYIEKID